MRVSVVMAIFNGARYLEEQLLSILRNSWQPDEIVVIDDHSIDESLSIIEKIASAHPAIPIKIHRNEKNMGASHSFILGTQYTLGDVIFFSDQDDVWKENKIEALMVPFLSDPNVLLAYSDGYITDHDLNRTGETIFSTRRKITRADQHRALDDIARDPDIKGCTMAVRGSLIENATAILEPDPFGHWGHDQWLSLFAFGLGRVVVIPKQLLDHRFHGGNTSGGVKFDPLKPGHWKKWIMMARQQEDEHDIRKYMIALDHVQHMEPRFNIDLKAALQKMLLLAKRRDLIRKAKISKRVPMALELYREGVYQNHFNGLWTMIRDIIL